jgi:hypothetical protein
VNVSEANDFNLVLCYLLGLDGPMGRVDPESARNAALRLTARAHRALSAGLNPLQVHDAWPMPNRRTKGASK